MDWTAGVYGDVWLEARDSLVNIRDVRIISSVERGELSADVELENGTDKPAEVEVAARADEWRPADARSSSSCALPGVQATVPPRGRATARLSGKWANPKLWSPDTPHLYSLRVQARGEGFSDECFERFGFREFVARKGRFWLNGIPFVFRSETAGLDGGGLYTGYNRDFLRRYLLFLRGMNYNGSGFGVGRGLSMEKFAEVCDEVGFVWLPGWNSWSRDAYRRLKNHPSLVGWSTDTWVTLQKWDNQPKKLGTDYFPGWLLEKRKQMLEHEAEIKRTDPTRVVVHYGCGNVGDIWCNLPYMGFGVPLQAREEVPRDWSGRKLVALYCAEFDFPFMYDWRDIDSYERQQFMWDATRYKAGLHHEHAARYFGEAAYGMSKRLHPNWSDGRDEGGDVAEMVARVNRLFIERTLRSWRAYEVSGLGLFGLTTGGYAHVVTDFSRRHELEANWDSLKTPDPKPHRLRVNVPITELNDVGLAVRDALSPILAFIGGHPDFVTKDHAYFSGERIQKQAVLVNGSATDADVAVEWWLTDEADKERLRGQVTVPVPAGSVKSAPIALEPLDVPQRARFDLHLRARGAMRWLDVAPDGQRREAMRTVESADTCRVEVFPQERAAPPAAGRVAVFDPQGRTAALAEALGLRAARVDALRDLIDYRLLLIGREALGAGAIAAELLKAVREGLNVVCFEQTPEGLLGDQLVQVDTRRAFITIPDHPVLRGVQPEDLMDWRGASDLCEAYPEPAPETERTYPEAYWHWSNRGMVSTYALRKPVLGNARAILSCGFDLAASPLLECVEGKGRILFCQLDVTSRCGADPVATKLVRNLIAYGAAAKPAEERPLCALKSERVAKLLGWLHFDEIGRASCRERV
jgi:beta-galactosidase